MDWKLVRNSNPSGINISEQGQRRLEGGFLSKILRVLLPWKGIYIKNLGKSERGVKNVNGRGSPTLCPLCPQMNSILYYTTIAPFSIDHVGLQHTARCLLFPIAVCVGILIRSFFVPSLSFKVEQSG